MIGNEAANEYQLQEGDARQGREPHRLAPPPEPDCRDVSLESEILVSRR